MDKHIVNNMRHQQTCVNNVNKDATSLRKTIDPNPTRISWKGWPTRMSGKALFLRWPCDALNLTRVSWNDLANLDVQEGQRDMY